MPDPEMLYFNGINGATGGYLMSPLSVPQIAAMAKGEPIDARMQLDLATRYELSEVEVFGASAGIDTSNLGEAGWGVVFAHGADPAVREALAELLDFRRGQASQRRASFYREFSGVDGYQPGESARAFLARHGVDASQPADPDRGVPYYILIVGDPEHIPFRFQYQLDVQYAVGRIWFDTLDEYASYARSVVTAEKGLVRLPRRAALFGVQNLDDRATKLSVSQLITPLAEGVPRKLSDFHIPSWSIDTITADGATKSRLGALLGGPETPALLFTASHGMGFPIGDPRQFEHQGALLCQDWPGPRAWRQAIPPDHYFAADDISSDASLLGMIAFHFACYGAGTPRMDDFAHQAYRNPVEIAPQAFVSKLPRRLLGHPKGGALAVIGHVERAWGYSFSGNQLASQTQSFESTLLQLMQGEPVGTAVDYFNGRYAALATQMSEELERLKFSGTPDDPYLAGLWTAHNDARSYVVLGDPAVRLPLKEEDETDARPPIEPIVLRPTQPAQPAGGGGDSAFGEPPESPESSSDTTSLRKQISDTERRYAERRAQPPSFDATETSALFIKRNDPNRLRWRLQQLGITGPVVDELLRYGTSYSLIRPLDDMDEVGEPPDDRWLERILGHNNMVDAPRFLEAGARAACAVGRIRIRSASGLHRGFGTGFLISPRLLLTNNHVLRQLAAVRASIVEFNVHEGHGGSAVAPIAFAMQPDDFYVTDRGLDFTLVAVSEQGSDGTPLEIFGWNRIHLGDDPILIEERVNIIQHPSGRPKQVALRDNVVTDLLPDFLHYRADTEPGSSGSPVFNDQWQLVALHHSGVPRRDGNGNILARDGGIWREEMGDQSIDWIANEGVRLSRILEFVCQSPLQSSTAARLRDELLNSTRPEGALTMSEPSKNTSRLNPSGSSILATAPATNAVTLSIPLQISVSLGAATTPVATTSAPTSAAIVPTSPPLEEAVTIDPDYDGREGYDPEFFGRGDREVPLPKLTASQRQAAARLISVLPGADHHELKYHHYSVIMNGRRRLAFFTAVNIDGKKAREVTRERDKWFFDPRISRDEQIGNELYASNPFDRGHLVRRLDPAWGRTFKIAKVANDDTFHWTNCSPQHERFNQGHNLWQGVENYLLTRATGNDQRLTVFTGAVFRDDDPVYRGVQIPLEYWKVAVLVGNDGQLKSLGFIVTQENLIGPLVEEAAVDTARLFQTAVAEIEELTGHDFGTLASVDVGTVDVFAPGEARGRVPLTALEQIRIPQGSADAMSFGPETDRNVTAKEPVDGTDLGYYLLAYDADCRERTDHPAGLISEHILRELATEPVTDVFLFSHGWQGDVPAAREQYQGWLKAMAACQTDRQRIRQLRPGFRPLLIGIHWPSLPWGDERLAASASFAVGEATIDVEQVVNEYAAVLGDTDEVRAQVRAILEAAREDGEPDQLPQHVLEAYRALDNAVALPKTGVAGAPGADWDVFDPEGIYQEFRADATPQGGVSFGLFSRDTLLAPLRTMSFWKMKDRARLIGEQALHPFLRKLMQATEGRDVRFHLAGHSFGCIVASAAIAGAPGSSQLPGPVDSLALLQGALSLWSNCSNIPEAPGKPGYFHRINSQGLVRGPIITTQSRHDTAVGTWYPRAAQVAGQVVFAPGQFPKYGAIGTFGIQGPGIRITDTRMLPANFDYGFRPGHVYNVDGSQYINIGGGISGAHSDIRKIEVGHLVWCTLFPF